MTATGDVWTGLGAWGDAIAGVLYADLDGRPAYLDLTDEVWASVADRVGVSPADAPDSLFRAVRRTLDLRAKRFALRSTMRRVDAWAAEEMLGTPPHLPFLAALSEAAEHMGEAEDLAAHNYYGQLFRLLGVDGQAPQRFLVSGYRDHAVRLWRTLNEWVDAAEGARGTSTAESLGSFRYVGLPLSQALVRAADRSALVGMFEFFDLTPGATITAEEGEVLLQEWVARGVVLPRSDASSATAGRRSPSWLRFPR